jgi:hypothetical protein
MHSRKIGRYQIIPFMHGVSGEIAALPASAQIPTERRQTRSDASAILAGAGLSSRLFDASAATWPVMSSNGGSKVVG